jgi:hypothetical protein
VKRTTFAIAFTTLALSAGAALAHHSYAMFDKEKSKELTGTVAAFKWTNPHAWSEIMVPDGKGGSDKWGIEFGSPAALVRAGWRSTTLKPGDAVVMTIRPLRSGEHGGAFVSVKLPDGRVLTDKAPASPS